MSRIKNGRTREARGANQTHNQLSGRPHRPGVAQPKAAGVPHAPKQPAAPPVYRPQPAHGALQTKAAGGAQPSRAGQTSHRPNVAAPAVNRPQERSPVQRKAAAPATRRQPVAPATYRPEQKKLVQPKAARARGGAAVQAALNPHAAVFVPGAPIVLPPPPPPPPPLVLPPPPPIVVAPPTVGAAAVVVGTVGFNRKHIVAAMAANSAKTVGEQRDDAPDYSTVLLGTYIRPLILADAQGRQQGANYRFTQRASVAGVANIQLAEKQGNGTYHTIALGMFNYTVHYRVNAAANRITMFHLGTA